MLMFMIMIDDIDQANIFENPQLYDFKIECLEHIMTMGHLSNDNVIIVRNLKRMGVWAQQGDIIHAISAMLP